MRLRLSLFALVAAAVALTSAAPASASPSVRFGIQDDAWLASGPGTLASRLTTLQRLGVDVVRFTVRWDEVAARGPTRLDWRSSDRVLRGLRARRIAALVTLVGTPGWANGRRGPNVAPRRGATFAAFAAAAARRYPWVRDWLIWNEPNLARWLRPASPATYVAKLLNPAYAAIHRVNRRARVGGGVTAPRGNVGGVSPVAWIRGMRRARARLDAYAHHPYPASRVETPFVGGCRGPRCTTITMANLELLLAEARRAFGGKRIWLTEYGYQTNPPDRILGVPPATQARYIGEAALRVYRAPRVDMLIHYLYRDEPQLGRFQSGLVSVAGRAKLSALAYPLPLAQTGRRAGRAMLWGQVRPRGGAQPYRLQLVRGARRTWLGGTRRTNARGYFSATLAAPRGAIVRVWSPRDRAFGAPLVLR